MSQKKDKKDRTCDHCKGTFRVDAKGIKAHAGECARLTRLGLSAPGGMTLK